MGKRKKFIEFIQRNPRKVRFDELISLLEYYGFTVEMNGTSHAKIKQEGYKTFVIPRPHGKESYIKEPYVKEAIEAIHWARSCQGD